MLLEVSPKYVNTIERTAVLQQTSFWASVKQKQGCETKAFDITIKAPDFSVKKDTDKDLPDATDDILVILHRINADQYYAYVPYGPVLEPEAALQGPYLEELSENLRPFLPAGCLHIRYDLRWESQWADDQDRYDEENRWLGPPDSAIQELRLNFNTHNRNLRKSFTGNLPSSTLFINLGDNTEHLLKRMRPKTRYNIRLSQRKGVMVREVTPDCLPVWYDLYRQTAQRNHIVLQDIGYFESVLEAKAKKVTSPADIHLLLAEAEGVPLAGMFLAMAGGRATYLYGASASHHRNSMAAYALQWEAIQKARQVGCKEYDMFGVSQRPDSTHPMYGLYRFKTGFGGYLFHRMGCWDYPLKEKEYEHFRISELYSRGYHIK